MSKEMTKLTGGLGVLYERISYYGRDPSVEIERLAKQALYDGTIDNKRYIVLQYRTPFYGLERETFEQIRIRIGTCRERPHQLEGQASRTLDRYLSIELAEGNLGRIRIVDLPWKIHPAHNAARKVLRHRGGVEMTIGDMLTIINAESRKDIDSILGNLSGPTVGAIYETFGKIGVNLPDLDL